MTAFLKGLKKSFLAHYLLPRTAEVLVGASKSAPFPLANMVFQGTVLGPCLWNIFFADVHEAAPSTGGVETRFADDLNVFKIYPGKTTHEEIHHDLRQCQMAIHDWGVRNRMTFDAKKKHFCILHPEHGAGDNFRLLGPTFDPRLKMEDAVHKATSQAQAKLPALLRTTTYYHHNELVRHFKTHLLGLLETFTGAIHHATDTTLNRLDNVQTRFLCATALTPEHAFLHHNLAPTSLRRDIPMLGFLHKCATGTAHPYAKQLFPVFHTAPTTTRMGLARHHRQVQDSALNFTLRPLEVYKRSLFGLVKIYNLLPAGWVAKDVKILQQCVTRELPFRGRLSSSGLSSSV